jgi:hypothetical protein
MTVLHESLHARLELDAERKLVRFVRTEVPFGELTDAIAIFRRIIDASATIDRGRHVVLIDLRRVTGRNDEAFEQGIAASRRALFVPFAKRATLVRTMAGKLQIQRLNRTDTMNADVFDDEAEAIAHLLA